MLLSFTAISIQILKALFTQGQPLAHHKLERLLVTEKIDHSQIMQLTSKPNVDKYSEIFSYITVNPFVYWFPRKA